MQDAEENRFFIGNSRHCLSGFPPLPFADGFLPQGTGDFAISLDSTPYFCIAAAFLLFGILSAHPAFRPLVQMIPLLFLCRKTFRPLYFVLLMKQLAYSMGLTPLTVFGSAPALIFPGGS
ncbi:MAG TPA: hypothetical protein IAB22_10420 [Candidatus Merdivicinus intestinavium]|nr:hypothetical protein [Candidatus Merdivicinus intestinavium]